MWYDSMLAVTLIMIVGARWCMFFVLAVSGLTPLLASLTSFFRFCGRPKNGLRPQKWPDFPE